MKQKIINFFTLNFIIFLLPIYHLAAAVDKTPITQEEMIDKVYEFDWVTSDTKSQVNVLSSNAFLYLNQFHYADILTNYNQVQQLMFWANGVEYPSTTHYIDIFIDNEKSYTINIEKFTNDGYIKGDDWDNVDAESFIKELKSGSDKANKERVKNGYATVEDITWHIKPSYNKELGYVFYSLLVKFNDGSETYNSTAMVLGRKGYTDITFLFKESIADVMPTEIDKVVKNFKYNQGSQYTDFKSGDKIAAYGVGALVAGSLGIKGLAKTGALAAVLAFAKKAWFIVLFPFIFLFRKLSLKREK